MPWRITRELESCVLALFLDPVISDRLALPSAPRGCSARKALVRPDVAVIGPVARIGVASRPFASIIDTRR